MVTRRAHDPRCRAGQLTKWSPASGFATAEQDLPKRHRLAGGTGDRRSRLPYVALDDDLADRRRFAKKDTRPRIPLRRKPLLCVGATCSVQ